MTLTRWLARTGWLLAGVILFAPGCVVEEPREGYYDREHHRWYHEHTWRECREHDEVCR